MVNQKGKKVTILDCTLRDGGYCTNWQFDKEVARDSVEALNRAGVNIIEIGYKNPGIKKDKAYEGLFQYCTESQLQFLKDFPQAEYAFMVDTKEFLNKGSIDISRVEKSIPHQENSVFSWVRIATYYPNLEASLEFSEVIKHLGYKVTVNLMGTSLLSDDEINGALDTISRSKIDVFYFSDSFGDLEPTDVTNWIARIRECYKGNIGIHTHDNDGLAFANTVAALKSGVDFIDSTIMGMGRGAGNLRTEQILLYLYFKMNYRKLNPSVLLEVIDTYFIPLQNTCRWGGDYTYMLSAMQNIHPTYCQKLRASNLYTTGQVSKILNSIDISQRSKFNEEALLNAIDNAVNDPIDTDEPLVDIPRYAPKKGRNFLIIATGPSVKRFQDELVTFISQNQPVVIECNPKNNVYESVSADYLKAILNWVRLKKALDNPQLSMSPIVTGMSGLPESYAKKAKIVKFPCHVSKIEVAVNRDSITLPAYDVGMFAVGLATLSNPEIIYTAGFDGFDSEDKPKQKEMNMFWDRIKTPCPVISLTPTTYAIDKVPIYRFIK